MYIRELLTFIEVADQGSFLKASKKLFITPASVMNQVNKVESLIGVKLFDRTNQGTHLTTAGRSIYKDAKKIIKQSEQAISHARHLAHEEQQSINIGTSILRPCKTLVDLWTRIENNLSIKINIIPFDDNPSNMKVMLESLGREIDCFVGPCDSLTWKKQFNILYLSPIKCSIAVPRNHKLAKMEKLKWEDLKGEKIMMVKNGESSVINQIRNEIEEKHPEITIVDTPFFYDTSVFNECVQSGCLMETLDIWKDVHPSLVTLPMEWNYQIPYGIIYSKKPSDSMQLFIRIIENSIEDIH